MNISVYCGASLGNSEVYSEAAKALGKWIADNGHTLVYGGGKVGLMGVIADEVLLHKGEVIGIIPTFLVERELSHPNLTRLEIVNSMSERKNKMIELGDCYIALPGGPGTLEEISEVISWARIGQHQNPCILLNVAGYYDQLKDFYKGMVTSEFLTEDEQKAMLFADSFVEIEQYIKDFSPVTVRTY
ncbi:TIGR00730 family Rossman fold protein [Lysinibacillus mangiferihumi]|uniref:Cytokinin riboside 5'-monophosphate phosphoribohydrolase n=1 Tax=Lysinibacillus mangiferihumi TaxID=1130819 RepID=A0A4U2Y0L0_9BACI|nr:TIGR00730 family Rossman fold protein [Lysinibacillus mangiferihumi]TKI53365.1 TIGR00730 family Rossman fold protein [Lysinibacillus mangiferihumi]